MLLTSEEKDFLKFNKEILERLINKRLEDFKLTSINAPTQEEREKARLIALEFQNYLGLITDLTKRKRKKKEYTGV